MPELMKEILQTIDTFCQELLQEGCLTNFSMTFDANPHSFPQGMETVQQLVNKLQLLVQSAKVSCSTKAVCSSPKEEIQIKADRKEMNRRISAFMAHKRMEVDQLNLQEFCNWPHTANAQETSCARVDAVLIKRKDCKSHIKVSRVVNQWGPQTVSVSRSPNKSGDTNSLTMSIEERLHNMETHLKLKSSQLASNDIFERIRNLEDRILFLEGLSPDYFDTSSSKRQNSSMLAVVSRRGKRGREALSLDEIDARIQILKSQLQSRHKSSTDES